MNEQLLNLKIYMVKRFILVLAVMVLMERGVEQLFSHVIFPILEEWIRTSFVQLNYQNEGVFFGVVIYLLSILADCIIELLPFASNLSLSAMFHRFSNSMLHVNTDIFMFANKLPSGIQLLIKIFVLLLVLVLLAIALLPYVISVGWYVYIVNKKINEQVDLIEKDRNLMLADIAHDLKTPLTTIKGYAQALVDDVEEDEEKKKEYLQNIYRKSERTDELLTLLFEYIKLESKGFTLNCKEEDVCEIVRENVAFLFMDFEQKGILLHVDIPEQPVYASVDKMQFSRAVANILGNMLKYNEKGADVFVRLRVTNDIEIHIGDNGVPIDDELARTIFEPFIRGDASRTSKKGSGLGLSIALKIIRMHGGNLILKRGSSKKITKEFVILL